MVAEFLANPDEGTKEILETQLAMISEVERNIENWRPSAAPEALAPYCYIAWDASAGPTSCGNQASAYADYYGDSTSACFGSCTVYAYAYVSRTCGTTTNTNSQTCTDSGINKSCSASASLGSCSSSCYSNGYSSISCPSLFKSKSATSYSCSTGLCCVCPIPDPDPDPCAIARPGGSQEDEAGAPEALPPPCIQ
jgi:hypothetical protein